MENPLRAIDLYSGVGGWSLGLRLAGVQVVASYERWGPANETNFKNNQHQAQTVDIRRLSLEDLPNNIDIVVGSPPCTQFSFSNRGGGGDIEDGLRDIKAFLRIVDFLKPRFWAMENVPRVKKIIDSELTPGGALSEFEHLGCQTQILDMTEFGVPQRRRRCIAGNIDFELLDSYRHKGAVSTLGEIVDAFSASTVVDPIYGIKVPKVSLVDHIKEDSLSYEELRINKANKVHHTVYNAMPFPDCLDRPVRTITATCTRVSRESIIIPEKLTAGTYRRLTLRERACLQGFPLTFQFYGNTFSQKLRMIGNAVPPAFAYWVGHAMQGHDHEKVPPICTVADRLFSPIPCPSETLPDRVGARYPAKRNFKFAVPSLQLKSGVRFELCNEHAGESVTWRIAFYFGTSKIINSLSLDSSMAATLRSKMSAELSAVVSCAMEEMIDYVATADIANMQALWAHRGPGGTRPFMLLDKIDQIAARLVSAMHGHEKEAGHLLDIAISTDYPDQVDDLRGAEKLRRNPILILAGLIIGSNINPILEAGSWAARFQAQVCSA